MPGLEDHRPPLEALDQDPELVVGGEVHRPEDALAALRRRPTRSRPRAAPATTSRSSVVSKKPNIASLPPWNSSQRLVDLGADPAHRLAVALGQEELGLGVLEAGVLLAVEELHPLEDQRRHPLRVLAVEPERDLDEALQLAPRPHRPDRHACHGGRNLHSRADERDREGPGRRLREGPQPRPARAARSGQRARPPPLLPPAHLAGRPGGRDGGPRDDHARLQQLPRADRRRAGQAGAPATRWRPTAPASPARAC